MVWKLPTHNPPTADVTRRHHHRHQRRTASDIERQLRESITAHLLLAIIALATAVGAVVRLFVGGGWVAWMVLIFAALALIQASVNLRKLRAMRQRLRDDPGSAERIHAIPRVPFLQGWIGSRQ